MEATRPSHACSPCSDFETRRAGPCAVGWRLPCPCLCFGGQCWLPLPPCRGPPCIPSLPPRSWCQGGCDGGPGRRQEKMSIQFTNVTAHLPTVFICQGCREAGVRGGCLCDRSRCLLWQKFEGLCFLPQTRAAHSVRGLAGGLLSGQSRTVAEVLKHVAAGRMAQAQAVPSAGGGGKAPKAKQGP